MNFDILESIGLGLGLGLAAGFRVVVPFLALSAAALFGHLPLTDQMTWLGTDTAFIGLSIALLVEILAYSIPWFDHLADAVALPVAAIAGTLAMGIATNQLDPFAQWSLAIVAGGGTAAAIRGFNGFTRLLSSATTGGLGNVLIAIAELLGAIAITAIAFVAPLVALIVGLFLILVLVRVAIKAANRSRQPASGAE